MSSYPVPHRAWRFALTGLALAVGVAFAACNPGASPTAPAQPEVSSPTLQSATANQQVKADVCHVEGNGSYHIINVADPAVESHLDHGDWPVEAEICDTVDNDCDGDIDEGGVCQVAACPCYDADDLNAINFTCAALALAVNSPMGGAAGGQVSITDFSAGFAQNLALGDPVVLTCEIFDFTTVERVAAPDISTDAWNACNDLVVAKIAELEAACP